MIVLSRRSTFEVAAGLATGAFALTSCASKGEGGEDVSATEDLMREHGVLRRILVVYREAARLLRTTPANIDAAALGDAASLFKTFGEDYHERKLEEQHIFPAVEKAGGEAGGLVRTLITQHDRGRELTTYVANACAGGKISAAEVEPLARALEDFARMYEAHTAFEDTVVFQAWKKSMPKAQFDEMGDRFEDIERAQFKGDGFDMAVDRIAGIERRLGLSDLGRYTAAELARR